jgi:hypothetical protein
MIATNRHPPIMLRQGVVGTAAQIVRIATSTDMGIRELLMEITNTLIIYVLLYLWSIHADE